MRIARDSRLARGVRFISAEEGISYRLQPGGVTRGGLSKFTADLQPLRSCIGNGLCKCEGMGAFLSILRILLKAAIFVAGAVLALVLCAAALQVIVPVAVCWASSSF